LPPTPVDGTEPTLRLVADGQLRRLDTNAAAPTLVNPLDPGDVARVYAPGPPPAGRLPRPQPGRGAAHAGRNGALMWLVDGALVTRPVVEDGTPGADWERLPLDGIGCIDVDEEPAPPTYPTLDATTAMQLRAVEHLLRLIAPVAAPPAASAGTAGSRLPNLPTDP